MIKLGGLVTLKPITEADVFTATSKETGTTSVFKSKDARDAAIKAGTHEKRKDDKDGAVKDPTDKPKVNIFDKPKKDKEEPKSEPKSEPIEFDIEDIEDFSEIDDLIDQNKDKLSKQQIDKLTQLSADWEDAEGEMMMGGDDEADAEYQRAISSIKADIEDVLSEPKKDEPKDDGRPKDSTGGRAGNPEVNKAVRRKAKSLGVTAKQLGREEYERRMKKAAVEALTDSNFHSEARKLISVLEDKPEWAKNPNQDPNKPDIFSPEYKEWEKTSVYSSDLYDSAPGTDEIAHEASNQAGWDGVSALDAIAFDLKVNGSKELALKIQSAIEDTNESSTKLGRLLPEQNRINEGTRSQVGIIDRSGKIASGYVHYDGYPSNMKSGLKKHMKNEKDVLNLIKKGGARGIYNNKDIEYFNEKPSPIKGNMKTLSRYIKSAGSRGGAEYVYLYNMKDKKWYFADTYDDNELKKLF
jgi:hypothetical protein